MRIFVSWYDGYRNKEAKELYDRLAALYEVEHSPFSPHSGTRDPKWDGWYDKGLQSYIDKADVFIAAITKMNSGSTWMAMEYGWAYGRYIRLHKPLLFYAVYEDAHIDNIIEAYLDNSIQLPIDPVEAVRSLENEYKKHSKRLPNRSL